MRFFDQRASTLAPCAALEVGDDVTALAFDGEGLRIACGTADAYVNLYDLRSSKPQLTKEHQNLLPIKDVTWHAAAGRRLVLSADARVVKAWDPTSRAARHGFVERGGAALERTLVSFRGWFAREVGGSACPARLR